MKWVSEADVEERCQLRKERRRRSLEIDCPLDDFIRCCCCCCWRSSVVDHYWWVYLVHTSYLPTYQSTRQSNVVQCFNFPIKNSRKSNQARKAAENVQKWQWKEEEEEGKLNREVDNRKIQSSSNWVVMQRRLIAVKREREREEIDRKEIY